MDLPKAPLRRGFCFGSALQLAERGAQAGELVADRAFRRGGNGLGDAAALQLVELLHPGEEPIALGDIVAEFLRGVFQLGRCCCQADLDAVSVLAAKVLAAILNEPHDVAGEAFDGAYTLQIQMVGTDVGKNTHID